MGRLSRYSQQKNLDRIETFLNDNEQYIRELEMSQLSELIKPTIKEFLKAYRALVESKSKLTDNWAEDALTWANILTHRSKLL